MLRKSVLFTICFFLIWSCKSKTTIKDYTSALVTQAPGENSRLITVGDGMSEDDSNELRTKIVGEMPKAGCLHGLKYKVYYSPSKKAFQESIFWVEENLELAKEGDC